MTATFRPPVPFERAPEPEMPEILRPRDFRKRFGLTQEDLFSLVADGWHGLPVLYQIGGRLFMDMGRFGASAKERMRQHVRGAALDRRAGEVRNRQCLLSLTEFARRYGFDEDTLLRLAVCGDYPDAVCLHGRVYFEKREVRRWESSRRVVPMKPDQVVPQ